MNFDFLFLGKLFPKDIEYDIKSKMKTGMQDAANALQWNIIEGLDANDCGHIRILDYLPVNSYPKGYTDKTIQEYVFQHTSQYRSDDKIVKCTNLSIVKQFANLPPFKKEANKWATDGGKQKKILMLYTANALFLKIAKYIKQINPDIETCCIIADLPEFSSARTLHGIRKFYNDFQARQSAALYQYVDKFVLLTEQMAERLQLKAPYVVMEGIAPKADVDIDVTLANQFSEERYILYSGTLNYEFGIGTLLEAFKQIQNPDLKLVICGFGEAEEAILNATDKRIVYLGKVDRKQALALQRKATVLVNPRQNNNEFTKYSFPSKTMEYLASGVPVVAYKLDGIPDEYDEYLTYPDDNTPTALARSLTDILSMPLEKRKELGMKGKNFVISEKNAKSQTLKIIELLTEV